jgi:clathrin heavy chain
LYSSTNQYDQAINVIIEHSPDAFTHEQFLNIITRVKHKKLLFRGILFYLEEEPKLLNNLLQVIGAKLDSTKLVQIMQKTNNIEIIADFLKTLQHENVAIVNDEINKF